MSENNSVTVRIYGQEYSISADMPREYIMRVADYVDNKMNELGLGNSIPMSSVAVLAAINICDELMHSRADMSNLTDDNEALRKTAEKYSGMWDEAKNTVAQYKAEIEGAAQLRDNLQKQCFENDQRTSALTEQITKLSQQNDGLKTTNDTLRHQISVLTDKLEESKNAPDEANKMIEALKLKCRDIESSFFDIQMENIRLKNEIESLKKQMK